MRHSIRRLKERYSRAYDTRERQEITYLIRVSRCVQVRTLDPYTENYAVHYGGGWVYVGFDPQRRRLKTALPLNDNTRREIVKGFMGRERWRAGHTSKQKTKLLKGERREVLERQYRGAT